MRRWLNGKGRQPVTWQTLIECVDSVGLSHIVSTWDVTFLPNYGYYKIKVAYTSFYVNGVLVADA